MLCNNGRWAVDREFVRIGQGVWGWLGSGLGQPGRMQPARRQKATKAIARRFSDFLSTSLTECKVWKHFLAGPGGWPGAAIPAKSSGGGLENLKLFQIKTQFLDNPFSKIDK